MCLLGASILAGYDFRSCYLQDEQKKGPREFNVYFAFSYWH